MSSENLKVHQQEEILKSFAAAIGLSEAATLGATVQHSAAYMLFYLLPFSEQNLRIYAVGNQQALDDLRKEQWLHRLVEGALANDGWPNQHEGVEVGGMHYDLSLRVAEITRVGMFADMPFSIRQWPSGERLGSRGRDIHTDFGISLTDTLFGDNPDDTRQPRFNAKLGDFLRDTLGTAGQPKYTPQIVIAAPDIVFAVRPPRSIELTLVELGTPWNLAPTYDYLQRKLARQ